MSTQGKGTQMRFLLVGTHFAPGAVAVIAKGLGQGAKVTLRAEPDNPYDAQAVKVWVERDAVAEGPELEEALAGFGLSVASIAWPLALGHLGAKYETKAAKVALREGHQFRLVSDWHGANEATRGTGRLIQHANGTCLVEVTEEGTK